MSNVAVPETKAVSTMPDLHALQQASEYGDPQGLAKLGAVGFNFLPRLQLFTSNSDEVKRGVIPLAHYGIIRGQDPVKPLGKAVVISPLAYRAKAMDLKSQEKPLAYHKPQSEEFKAVRVKADTMQDSGCMYGPEFLVWVPSENCYATYFMGSKTARNVAPGVRALQPKSNGSLRAGILDSQFIEANGYSWHGPTIKVSDQAIDPMPDMADIMDVVTNFLNPVDSVPEAPQPKVEKAAVNTDR